MGVTLPSRNLMQSYIFYSAVLALKLMILVPLTALVCRPEKVQRANISDLKNLTPFWLVAGLYLTTGPDEKATVNLLRLYVVVRFIVVLGYIMHDIPKILMDTAFWVSFTITGYMGGSVVYTYRNAL